MKRESLILDLFQSMMSVFRTVHTCAPMQVSSGIPTRAQMGILMIVKHAGEQSIKELAEKLSMTSSAATQLVDGLVDEKLLTRKEHKEDRRKISITLTAKGIKRMEEANKRRLVGLKKVVEPLTDEELLQWTILHKKILQHQHAHA